MQKSESLDHMLPATSCFKLSSENLRSDERANSLPSTQELLRQVQEGTDSDSEEDLFCDEEPDSGWPEPGMDSEDQLRAAIESQLKKIGLDGGSMAAAADLFPSRLGVVPSFPARERRPPPIPPIPEEDEDALNEGDGATEGDMAAASSAAHAACPSEQSFAATIEKPARLSAPSGRPPLPPSSRRARCAMEGPRSHRAKAGAKAEDEAPPPAPAAVSLFPTQDDLSICTPVSCLTAPPDVPDRAPLPSSSFVSLPVAAHENGGAADMDLRDRLEEVVTQQTQRFLRKSGPAVPPYRGRYVGSVQGYLTDRRSDRKKPSVTGGARGRTWKTGDLEELEKRGLATDRATCLRQAETALMTSLKDLQKDARSLKEENIRLGREKAEHEEEVHRLNAVVRELRGWQAAASIEWEERHTTALQSLDDAAQEVARAKAEADRLREELERTRKQSQEQVEASHKEADDTNRRCNDEWQALLKEKEEGKWAERIRELEQQLEECQRCLQERNRATDIVTSIKQHHTSTLQALNDAVTEAKTEAHSEMEYLQTQLAQTRGLLALQTEKNKVLSHALRDVLKQQKLDPDAVMASIDSSSSTSGKPQQNATRSPKHAAAGSAVEDSKVKKIAAPRKGRPGLSSVDRNTGEARAKKTSSICRR
ncbi:unnamed protein product [Vitrella brassicaformis CCMP3155]|uniref:Uncharacterized protein n=2 Tax=Vitrella brassicaformis TaxID=1169539 RepID=A0A0G4G7K0_VITBC|nr:unnamed protein product [Vitrella brassicaformis CCMP3155]|eukprot:CEM24379.1 unnamed protein product [Vitrella brassicaformis CCMP3155]